MEESQLKGMERKARHTTSHVENNHSAKEGTGKET